MQTEPDTSSTREALCGQADAVFDSLWRTQSLPAPLCLTIETLLETAWEIAYHRPTDRPNAKITSLAAYRNMQR